ncbi:MULTISPECIES: hypothetical protein [Streptomyces]|uniref:Uncharacterized protein n=3 Tax=Streptomyces TaxID=1883 RepID=A0A3S9PJZ1_STRLT|nr:hypothetical protein [Streptomyces luteoverticillatus]AZQ72665.1 hypothetical protein EKH77_16835 [Streptomyces luteoverticillatus]
MAGRDRRGSGSAARTPRETTEADPRKPGSSIDPAGPDDGPESADDRRRRRAQFLRELNEAKELRDRVQPRRARAARMRQQMRMRTFRW